MQLENRVPAVVSSSTRVQKRKVDVIERVAAFGLHSDSAKVEWLMDEMHIDHLAEINDEDSPTYHKSPKAKNREGKDTISIKKDSSDLEENYQQTSPARRSIDRAYSEFPDKVNQSMKNYNERTPKRPYSICGPITPSHYSNHSVSPLSQSRPDEFFITPLVQLRQKQQNLHTRCGIFIFVF